MKASDQGAHEKSDTLRHLEGYLQSYPGLRGRVCRVLLLHLHTQGLIRIEDVYRRAERADEFNIPADPNLPASRLWAADETEVINRIVIELAAEHLTPKTVDEIVWAAHRRDEAQSVETLARMPDVPLELIADKVGKFVGMPGASLKVPQGTLSALIRRFIADRPEYISIARNTLSMRDVSWVLDRVVGAQSGQGSVGGKAAGMLLATSILRREDKTVRMPDTAFVLTDAYEEFKRHNGLTELSDHKYREMPEIRGNYRAIREIFSNAEFPARIADHLAAEMERWGEAPLIVRSSSLLEDSFGAAFSGIYHSLFLSNQGDRDTRLRKLLGAIAEIYAGVFSPHAIHYRKRHGLLDHDERMGVMIQPVVGARYGPYFHPAVAGVAFSRNDYRWSRRIRREDGLVRLVIGLGTRAVDRVGDYARMVPLEHPTMRPEGTAEEIVAASQRYVDVVDLDAGTFKNVSIRDVLDNMREEGIADYVSMIGVDGVLSQPIGTRVPADTADLCVTFDRLLQRGEFPRRISNILKRLEQTYQVPVDLEFAINGDAFYVLQCRPLGGSAHSVRKPVPRAVEAKDRVFSARRYVNSGVIQGIGYIVLVDPRDYNAIDTIDRRVEVAHAIGEVNERLAKESFILMGPGRWGSQDIRLGVQVGFGDISNADALVEIARTSDGFTPEPSFGTHFFQELIEAGISYVPLYPDAEGIVYNEAFLLGSENALASLCPGQAGMADVVRVIDVEAIHPGRRLDLVMDGELQEALCFLN
ncbi:MAG: PEP/pyruvate-binding domain-containing protein [Planctomycetota bacterium]|jgi:hypothetical protein